MRDEDHHNAEASKLLVVKKLGPTTSIHHRASFFVIRRSKSSPATVCQQHGDTSFSLFSLRPQWPGQRPSLSLGASILYKLGHVTLQDSQSSVVDGHSLLVHRETDQFDGSSPQMEMRRLEHSDTPSGRRQQPYPTKSQKARYPLSVDDTLCFCTEYLLDRFFSLPSS
jgi:hypothetical protein